MSLELEDMAHLDNVEEGVDGSIEVALSDQYGDFDSMLTSELEINGKQSSDSEDAADGCMKIMPSSVESGDHVTIGDHTSDSSTFRFQGSNIYTSMMDDDEDESDSSSLSSIPRENVLGSDIEVTHKHELRHELDSFLDASIGGTFLHGTVQLSGNENEVTHVIDVSNESLSIFSISSCHDHEHDEYSIMSCPFVGSVNETTSYMKHQQRQRRSMHDHFSDICTVCSQTSLLDLTITKETASQLQELEGFVDDAVIVSAPKPLLAAPFPSKTNERLNAAIQTKRIDVASDELSVSVGGGSSVVDGLSTNLSHRARRARIERIQREVQGRYPILLGHFLENMKSSEAKARSDDASV